MKTLRICGWAVILTATLLLAACASHTLKAADTDMMSGPDATMSQHEQQMQSLELRENALTINRAWLDERESQLAKREAELNRRENALVINQAWLDEHEATLAQRESVTSRQRNALAINRAWLDEREAQLEQRAGTAKSQGSLSVAETGSPMTKIEAGHCYARVFVPAQYRTVAVVKPIESPTDGNAHSAYQTVTERVKIADEKMSWEEILCEKSMTECRIKEIQRSLFRGGYDPGPIDGVIGKQTMAAVNAFQKDFNLTVANFLTTETVMALDANF